LRCLVDGQLPPALARHLSAKGHYAEHLNDIGLGVATVDEIWSHAKRIGAVTISKDEDFIHLARRDRAGAQVVWIRLGNVSNNSLWKAIELLLPEILEAIEAGERLIEVA
jgi:predicted nuclease of predicted toxin-antitoxin system